jgi:hypothetical protein
MAPGRVNRALLVVRSLIHPGVFHLLICSLLGNSSNNLRNIMPAKYESYLHGLHRFDIQVACVYKVCTMHTATNSTEKEKGQEEKEEEEHCS